MPRTVAHDTELARLSFTAVAAAFESLGKVVAFVDAGFKIVNASPAMRGLVNAPDVEGRPIGEFFDIHPLMDPLQMGKRSSARCAFIAHSENTALITAAPLADGAVEPDARYVFSLELRDEDSRGEAAPEEAERIRHALEENRWRRTATARSLGISRATLWRRMRDFGLL